MWRRIYCFEVSSDRRIWEKGVAGICRPAPQFWREQMAPDLILIVAC
jgi:hypothetical protein